MREPQKYKIFSIQLKPKKIMAKTRGIFIRRKDKTVEPDKDGKYPIKWFPCKINAAVPPSHRLTLPY